MTVGDKVARRLFAVVRLAMLATIVWSSVPAHSQTLPPSLPQMLPGSNLPSAGNPVTAQNAPIAAIRNLTLPANAQAIRRLNLQNYTGAPNLTLGGASINMQALNGPGSPLVKKLASLRDLSHLVQVKEASNEAVEVEAGLLVTQKLAYKVLPGACQRERQALIRAGADCGARHTLQSRIDALRRAGSPSFIPPGANRNKAEADLQSAEQEVLQGARSTRQFLSSAEGVRRYGQAEATRLLALSDQDLAAELLDSADTIEEEAFFIPKIDSLNLFPRLLMTQAQIPLNPQFWQAAASTGSASSAQAQDQDRCAPGSTGNRNGCPPAATPEYRPVSRNLVGQNFLTGFTLGKMYEWRKRVSQWTPWKTYWVEAYTNFGFGLGLRFPLKVNLKYQYPGGRGATAQVTPTIKAFDASEAEYASVGLEEGKRFKGKELVAEYAATAGVVYILPGIGWGRKEFGPKDDLTSRLPHPYTNGNFNPPEPGTPGLKNLETFLEDLDLLMGYGNFGVVGAEVFPGLRVDLVSNRLDFQLVDHVRNRTQTIRSGQETTVGIDRSSGESHFTVGKPLYNLAFKITPGLKYRVSVDFAVWSNSWSDKLWIPQLEVKLPPNGVDFDCHSGTRCEKTYTVRAFAPEGGPSTAAARSSGGSTASTAPPGKCESDIRYGTWSFAESSSGRLARGGVTAEGRNDLVGLGNASSPTDPRRAWETFELFGIPGQPNGRWIRNTIDGRWLETINSTGTLNLKDDRGCNSQIADMQWELENLGQGRYLVRNMRNKAYVRVSQGLLKANANRSQATAFRFVKY